MKKARLPWLTEVGAADEGLISSVMFPDEPAPSPYKPDEGLVSGSFDFGGLAEASAEGASRGGDAIPSMEHDWSTVFGDMSDKSFYNAARRHRMWPVGDSITEGDFGGYRKILGDAWYNARLWNEYVGTLRDRWGSHDGHQGWTIPQLYEKIDEWMPKVNPDNEWPLLAFVMAGTNDAAGGAKAEVMLQNLRYLVSKITSYPNTEAVVMTIPPMPAHQVEVDAYNEGIRKIFNGWSNVIVADPANRFNLLDLEKDQVHPTMKGYSKIAGAILESLKIPEPVTEAPKNASGVPVWSGPQPTPPANALVPAASSKGALESAPWWAWAGGAALIVGAFAMARK